MVKKGFRIDHTNIDHLMSLGDTVHDKKKATLLKVLHFSKGKIGQRVIKLLKEIKW